MIIVNADDWGRSIEETNVALNCYEQKRISSTTGMVFMKDSVRAAEVARDCGIDVGLHLNLSENYTEASGLSAHQINSHRRIVRFLKKNKYSQLWFNPFLRKDFDSVYQSQLDEFRRLYRKEPSHVDGHQHMHLCMNMLLGKVIPSGQKVRRSFSFFNGEKSAFNRAFRKWVDSRLAARYPLTQYFFALSQRLESNQLLKIMNLARHATVELMTHPIVPGEQQLLMSPQYMEILDDVPLGNYTSV